MGLEVIGVLAQPDQVGRVEQAVEILKIIQRDEVGHVEIGTRWFRYLCKQRKLEPEKTFQDLLSQYMKGNIKGPLDRQARRQAGFTEAELDYLEGAGRDLPGGRVERQRGEGDVITSKEPHPAAPASDLPGGEVKWYLPNLCRYYCPEGE